MSSRTVQVWKPVRRVHREGMGQHRSHNVYASDFVLGDLLFEKEIAKVELVTSKKKR